MAKVLLVSGDTPTATTAGATQYWTLSTSALGASTVEVNKQIIYRSPGVLSHLYVRVTANTTSIASSVTVRNNAANTAMTVAIGIATSGTFEDTTNTATVAAGDKLDYRSISGGTGTMSFSIMSTVFTATTDTVSRITAGPASSAYTVDSTTRYAPLEGPITGALSVESIQGQTIMPKAASLKNLAVYVSTNTRVTDSTIRLRINASNGTITTPITLGLTGLFEDITHTDTVVAGDLVNYSIDTLTGAGESLGVQTFSIDFISTQGQGMLALGIGGGFTQNANVTNYLQMGGRIVAGTTEADRKLKTYQSFAFSALSIYVTANTVSLPSTLTFRKNGADSGLIATITASSTGYFDSLSATETSNPNDELNFKLTTGATGTSMTIRHITLAHLNFTAATKTITDPSITISETRGRSKASWRLQP